MTELFLGDAPRNLGPAQCKSRIQTVRSRSTSQGSQPSAGLRARRPRPLLGDPVILSKRSRHETAREWLDKDAIVNQPTPDGVLDPHSPQRSVALRVDDAEAAYSHSPAWTSTTAYWRYGPNRLSSN